MGPAYSHSASAGAYDDDPYPYKTYYYNATLDHFDFTPHSPGYLNTYT